MRSLVLCVVLSVASVGIAGECANCRPVQQVRPFLRFQIAPPAIVEVPEVKCVPYKHARTDNVLRRGPIMRWLFGPFRQNHIYERVEK